MRLVLIAVSVLVVFSGTASSQSLFILQGQRAAEGSLGWSVGPFSQGVEIQGAASLDGRWDVGFGLNRYSVDLGGDDDSGLTEWTPFVRYFLFKEDDDSTPLSVAAHGQFLKDDFGGDEEGWYVLAGGQLYKKFTLVEGLAVYPYVGFYFAAESYTFGGDPERALYITRQFGLHGQVALSEDAWLRVTAEEHSFRRETYRALRAAFIRRF